MKRFYILLSILIVSAKLLFAQTSEPESYISLNQSTHKQNAITAMSNSLLEGIDFVEKEELKNGVIKDDSEKMFKQFSFIPMPVLASNPASGFMFGVAPSMSWLFGDQATTSRSTLISTVLYTTKKQFLFFVKSNVFMKDDSWNILVDWRYFATSQPTYGLGTGSKSSKLAYQTNPNLPHSEFGTIEFNDASFIDGVESNSQLMNFDYIRLHQTALKRIADTRFFAGLGYHLDYHYNIEDNILDIEGDTITLTSHYLYAIDKGFDLDKSILSGVSINALYDSRDNQNLPTSGRYAFANFRINPKLLGSSKKSTTLWLEYRDYLTINKARPRNLIGFWTYGNFVTSGDVPYLDLPAIGWDQFGRSGRGFAQGRWRGQDLWYAEAEYRFPLQKHKDLLSGVVFCNATSASSRDNNIKLFEYVEPSGGIGLRIMLDKKAGTNLALDYAWGSRGSHGFYLSVNEVF